MWKLGCRLGAIGIVTIGFAVLRMGSYHEWWRGLAMGAITGLMARAVWRCGDE